jgi:uncharacterized protein (UPF0276 family)
MGLNVPVIGVGIGWRREIAGEIMTHRKHIDWCEVIAERYINVPTDGLAQITNLARMLPIVPHGVDLSIGTDRPLEDDYLASLAALVERLAAPWFSDHLCFTRVPGYHLGQLTPLVFSEEAIDIVVRKAKQVKERIKKPFLLENITYQFKIPGGALSESEFIARVLERADTGLLLDVCNLYINSMNHRYDPYEFLQSIPLDRVIQIHIAGGTRYHNQWIDSHSQPVPSEVFQLLDYVLAHAPVKGVLLERDANFPASFAELAAELTIAKELFKKYRGLC